MKMGGQMNNQKRRGKDGRELHGLTKHPLYPTWNDMKDRCYNKNNKQYHDYGGRGIKVCENWKNSFTTFLRDVGEKPTKKHTIDRFPNNDGDYEPSNIRWATRTQQERNKGADKRNPTGVKGVSVSKCGTKYEARIGIGLKKIHLGTHKTLESARDARAKAETIYWGSKTKEV